MPSSNCLSVSFSHAGELSGSALLQDGRVSGTFAYSGYASGAFGRISASCTCTAARATSFSPVFGLVCAASISGGVPGYDVLWAFDGVLLTVDNGNLYVVQE